MARGRPPKQPGTAASPKARKAKPQLPFAYRLVLNQWLLSLFNVQSLADLAEPVQNEALEGVDENNIHRFHHALTAQLFNLTQLPTQLLLEYDQNIVRHTQRLNERRITHGDAPIVWKYFQYLALLFTEIYLDRYFRDPDALRAALNAHIDQFNDAKAEADRIPRLDVDTEAATQLNKLAFWMATGAGKTLVMHANILQFQHYVERSGRRRDLNRIILLTPNEGLSQQHLREFETAGIEAELFSKAGRGLFAGRAVEIIEVTKLREDGGDKTVAVDAFEGNNLVLVDEGHRGTSGGGDGVWMQFRDRLCERGFSFEYSATFGQAVKGNADLITRYARCVLFDYSYKYFYGDGFGKDYQILNLEDDGHADWMQTYLTACLLSYFQQLRLFSDRGGAFKPFQIEKPLWIFVGGSVTASLGKQDASDIVEILLFLKRYSEDRQGSIERIRQVLHDGLVTAKATNLFAERFMYLNTCGAMPEQIYQESLAMLFNAPGGGQLYIENLKGATGEIALRLGAENEPFGVINVGDDAKLVKLCESHHLTTGEREFSGSLFHAINKPASTVNILIGSRKFTEGWSSWRVSTMGLMNVGKSEGAQIIQLFGRGVRLKGYGMGLKRSSQANLPQGVDRPKHIGLLETLGIFGIHADYMAQFREFLEDEGLPGNDDRHELFLPVIKNLGRQQLKTIRLKKEINGVKTDFGSAFRQLAPVPTLKKPDLIADPSTEYLQKNQVVIDWYPKIQAMKSGELRGGDAAVARNRAHLSQHHIAFLDINALYFELERFKAERGWYNFNLSIAAIEDLLADQSWYSLLIPEAELAFTSFEQVRLWQEIALALLKKYAERYYIFRKRDWELPHLEYRDLDVDDPNFIGVRDSNDQGYYRILIDRSLEDVVAHLERLKIAIESRQLTDCQFRGLHAICFGQHLYQPLLYLGARIAGLEITPAPLNRGERRFVDDLATFYSANAGYFANKELYLLRNLTRGKGVGFFEAGNFHPDFILWLLDGNRQHVVFVDPKGIRNTGVDDPKVRFHETVKEIEDRMKKCDPNVRLHSFIVSSTPSASMQGLWRMTKSDMQRRNILFQDEDQFTYVGAMLRAVSA